MNQQRSGPTFNRDSKIRLIALAVTLVLLTGCGDKKDKAASQTAVKVNKSEITVHQINFVLQQQRGLKPEQTDAASKQILERLIDQELALQKADDLKVDRDPRVVQQLEAAKRDIIARAYLERVGEAAPKPTPEEIKKYYEEKPALFKERRIYSLQEIGIEAKPDQAGLLREKLSAAKNINDFLEYLKSNDFKFSGNQAVRAAEQLPLQALDGLAKMRDGQAILNQGPNGVQVLVLASSRSQPVSEELARPAIEQFLSNERKRKLIDEDVKTLRAAAKIEYVGKFGEGVPSAAAAASVAALATATGVPSNGKLNATDINKGMGLK